jgi:hypothetical protein
MALVTSALPPELAPYAQFLEEFEAETGIRLDFPQLGTGGGGTVLKAKNQYGKYMAVKVIAAEDSASKDQALREADILKQVQRAHVRGGGEGLLWQRHCAQTDLFILGMDFIPGQTLTELIAARGPLDEATAIELTIGIARELETLHHRNIIHRDVKPDNIMLLKLGNRCQPVVVDYGIAKVGNNRTWRGARAATDGYAPPEQYTGGTDRRTDVYALGATLYEMVTGQTPLASVHRDSRDVLEPRLYAPKISLELERVIQIATASHPRQRFSTMGALIDALRLVEDGDEIALWSMLQMLGLLDDKNVILDSRALSLASLPSMPPLPAKPLTPAPPAKAMVCAHCQEPYQTGKAFCENCGAALSAEVAAVLVAASAQSSVAGVAHNLAATTPGPQFMSLLFAQKIMLGGPALGWLGKSLLLLAYWLLLASITLGARSLSVACSLAGALTVGSLVCFFLLFPLFVYILRRWDETVITRRGQAHWLRRWVMLLLSLGGLAATLYWLMGEVSIWQASWVLAPPPISMLTYLALAGFASLLIPALLA